jgi:dimethylargininase
VLAITRDVPGSIGRCELTHVARTPIDVARARAPHEEYRGALRSAGAQVICLAEQPEMPDSVFVEDTALVLDAGAVLMRPGAASRRQEVASIAEALRPYRALLTIDAPGTVDGGDVLVVDRTIWVGLSTRTNPEGVAQLRHLTEPWGFRVLACTLAGALHLKSAVTQVGPRRLLINPEWVDTAAFHGFDLLTIDPAEPFAANAVYLNDVVIHSTTFPRTQQRLRGAGVNVLGVDASELAKAEGGVTCCSLLIR